MTNSGGITDRTTMLGAAMQGIDMYFSLMRSFNIVNTN
jgi:hypothetical protein